MRRSGPSTPNAMLDSGCGEHPWLEGVVVTGLLDVFGDVIGDSDPATDPEVGGDITGPLDGALDWIADNYAVDNPVAAMVERSGLMPRTFGRRFRTATPLATRPFSKRSAGC